MNFYGLDNNLNIDSEINKNIKASIIKQIILLLSLVLIFIILSLFKLNTDKYLFCLTWIGSLTFFTSAYFYYKATGSIINPYIFFYFSFFCFQFGQWFLYSLGIKYDYIHLSSYADFWGRNYKILFNGTIMIIFSIAFFNLGALCSLIKRENNKNFFYKLSKMKIKNNEMEISGWLIFILTVIPTIYTKLSEMILSIHHGYSALYANLDNKPSLLNSIGILFIPSCILLLITYKNNRKMKFIVQVIMVIFSMFGLIGGGRTEGIAILLVLILFNTVFKVKFNMKKGILLLVSLVLVMFLVSTFAEFRGVENKNFNNFVSVLSENISKKNPVVSTIGEMGWSMGTVFMTMSIVPTHIHYDYGITYLASLSRIIPSSIDFTGTIYKLHDLSTAASSLVTNYYKTNFGMDSTLIAESYYNFGYFGVIFIFLIGLLIGKLLAYRPNLDIKNNDLALYIKLAGLYSILTLPRRHFGYLITQTFYSIFIVILIILIIRSQYSKIVKLLNKIYARYGGKWAE